MKYQAFTVNSFTNDSNVSSKLSNEEIFNIKVIGNVLPFKVNNYVINELIDWDNIPNDPIFQLTFPQYGMLNHDQFNKMANGIINDNSKSELKIIANNIRLELNPHPAGQMELNVPTLGNEVLNGLQHKYEQTVLFFPQNGQTCHSYCSFCFRWPQFIGEKDLKFASQETNKLVDYISKNKLITDVLFTGGDPLIMSTKHLRDYIEPIINSKQQHNVRTIRIGTKALGFWPYRFLTDFDADELLILFEKIVKAGFHLAFMAHFNHPVELKTDAVKKAIQRILNTGAQIRTQSPLLKHINNHQDIWKEMWMNQVNQGCIPYYMFVTRDTGAQNYFAVSLEESWEIFRKANQHISGIAKTVRGPSMSTELGKMQIVGIAKINEEEVFVLNYIQHRNPDLVGRPFFAKLNKTAIWYDELIPIFNSDNFFKL